MLPTHPNRRENPGPAKGRTLQGPMLFPVSRPMTPRKTLPVGSPRPNRQFPRSPVCLPGKTDTGRRHPATAQTRSQTGSDTCRPSGPKRRPKALFEHTGRKVTGAGPKIPDRCPERSAGRVPPLFRRPVRPLSPIPGQRPERSSLGEPPAAGRTRTARASTHCSHETGQSEETACTMTS